VTFTPRRFLPKTIAAQLTSLVIVAVLLGVLSASGVLLYLTYNWQPNSSMEASASIRAAGIAAIVKEARAARSPEELEQTLSAARGRFETQATPLSSLKSDANQGARPPSPFVAAVNANLKEVWGIDPLPIPSSFKGHAIIVKLDDAQALTFRLAPRPVFRNFFIVQTICVLAIVIFIVVFLSIYAVRWITSPLSSIASATRSFGKSTEAEEDLSAAGPREIAQLAEALNDMRKRVRTLVDERTKMLVAISHDLRTPLTRLRLRAERTPDDKTRDGMLHDIGMINEMLSETLAYLRDDGRVERAHLIDLPSLLQTICAQFADIGEDVSYDGPSRLTFPCRQQALTRAVTNIVDNATKHGSTVSVTLRSGDDERVEIDVSDDGPGIPAALRGKVFEPFFKIDSARSQTNRSAGFGLGLSIARDIARRHGGDVEFFDHAPHGLTVRLSVKGLPDARLWDALETASA
jgi:signal transduction histidine kinase